MMDKNEKENILRDRKMYIRNIQDQIDSEQKRLDEVFNKSKSDIMKMSQEDRERYFRIYEIGQQRRDEFKVIRDNPFFTRMTTDIKDKKKDVIYIGKFSFPEKQIYSWVTPIATLRFENLGAVSYVLPNGESRLGHIHDKESFMISKGEISYLSREDGHGKTLIYQKHFSEHLQEFGLSEIVARIEKIQDTIIRAHPKGPFLISGPAGSGKTTVALHRVAYLRQSPETAELYPGRSCAVFVQDGSTKEYFSKLLPDLGINEVKIFTFDEWAFNILDFKEAYSFVERYGKNFDQKNQYEYYKVQLIRNTGKKIIYFKDPFRILKSVYKEMPKSFLELLKNQEGERVFDKQDLTILLEVYSQSKGALEEMKSYHVRKAGIGQLIKKWKRATVSYSCVLVDEFQNYTPEQLRLIRSVVNEKTQSIIYVGDLNQQTHIGSIQSWEDIDESFLPERKVVLDKVYRNDIAILNFMHGIGYDVIIPSPAPESFGEARFIFGEDQKSNIEYIKSINTKFPQRHIGILAFDRIHLIAFSDIFSQSENIHIMTIHEAQGLEFDSVFIVGLSEGMFDLLREFSMPDGYREAYHDTVTDYLYVACTRAKTNLFIFTGTDIKEKIFNFVKASRSRRISL